MFSNKDIPKLLDDNILEFEYLSKYVKLYTDELYVVYNMIKLMFVKNIDKETLAIPYKNGISYSIIAGKLFLDKRYYESLLFAQKAKLFFIEENNYKRCITINFTILNSLASTGNFEEYYVMAREQFLTVKAFNLDREEFITSLKHLSMSAISLKKYKYACELIESFTLITLTDIFCIIIAKFNSLDEKTFYNWYENYICEHRLNEEIMQKCNILIDFIVTNDKRKIVDLEHFKISPVLIEILRWL